MEDQERQGSVYINKKHHKKAQSPRFGWMGHQSPFDFSNSYTATSNAVKFMVGTPYIFSLKALEGALEVFEGIDIKVLREQSAILCDYLMEAIKTIAPELVCISPAQNTFRGGHIAFFHDYAYSISRALIARGVICDHRAPNLIRMSANSLYICKEDIDVAINIIASIILNEEYLKPEYQNKIKVT